MIPIRGMDTRSEATNVSCSLNAKSQKAFAGIVTVSQANGVHYCFNRSPVPRLAARWVDWLVEDVNAAVKAQDVAEAQKSIEYLKQQISNTSCRSQAMFLNLSSHRPKP